MKTSTVPLLALATVAFAGCGSTSTSAGSSDSPSVPATITVPPSISSSMGTTAGATGSATGSATPTPGSSEHPTTGITRCNAAGIHLSWAPGGAAAGTDFGFVVVTNISPAPCVLSGVPVLFHAKASGEQVGAAGSSNTSTTPIKSFTLAKGQKAAAEYGDGNAMNYPTNTCKPVNVPGIGVKLPGETTTTFVAVAGQACSNAKVNTLTVTPFTTDYQPINTP